MKTEEELSEVPLSGKTFHMRHGVGETKSKKIVGVSQKFFKAFRYKRARTPLRELRLEKGDEEIRTTKAANFCCATQRYARARERVVFLGGT